MRRRAAPPPLSFEVTSWNILAPVWAHPSHYFPRSAPHLDPRARAATAVRRLLAQGSDALLLQEVEERVLQRMRRDHAELDATYSIHFAAYPPGWCANWLTEISSFKPVPNGVAVLLRRGMFSADDGADAAEFRCLDPRDGGAALPPCAQGNAALIVRCTWGESGRPLAFVCCHLDADSARLAERQATWLHRLLAAELVGEERRAVVWAGDFNLEMRCGALQAIAGEVEGVGGGALFRSCFADSGACAATPTFHGKGGSRRIDHIWATRDLSVLAAAGAPPPSVPQCPTPAWYVLGELPCHTTRMWLHETVLPSWPLWTAMCLALVAALPLTVVVWTVLRWRNWQDAQRSEWALAEMGSDHLPVTCTLTLSPADG